MGAPAGNRFWELRSKTGREKLFSDPDAMWEAATEYFKYCDDNLINNVPRPYTMVGLCLYLDCSQAYFRVFKLRLNPASETYDANLEKGFLTIIDRIEETIYNQKFTGAAVGQYKENLIARDLGLKDTTSNELSGPNGSPIPISGDIVFK